MNKKDAIEKIKKCLALSKSANQHEAATALRQAQSLMEKYNIDADDAELLGIVDAEILGSGSQKPPEIASYAFDVLYRQLKKARTTFINTNLKRVQIRTNKVKRADMFCEGWVIEASEQARRIKPNTEKLQQIEAHIKKTTELTTFKPKNRNEKTRDSSRSRNDYWSGRQAGKDAQINHGMNAGQQVEKLGVGS